MISIEGGVSWGLLEERLMIGEKGSRKRYTFDLLE